VILPDANSEEAGLIANKIKTAIDNLNIQHETSSIKPYVTVSMGIATYLPDSGLTDKHLVDKADKALYKAKERGRNNICFHIKTYCLKIKLKMKKKEKINN
jgi:diguanylate cyclase (GGDEF)-like protein